MQAINNLNLDSLLDTLVSLSAAFILGGLIGFERQYRQRTAGLRTNVLVAVGAAIFVDMANRLAGAEGAVRVVAYVVSGIGFLGAGVIMREEGNVRGLNTAATLWTSAAVGACAGADLLAEAVLGTLFILAANTLLRPIVNNITANRWTWCRRKSPTSSTLSPGARSKRRCSRCSKRSWNAVITRPVMSTCMPLVPMKLKSKQRWRQRRWTAMSWTHWSRGSRRQRWWCRLSGVRVPPNSRTLLAPAWRGRARESRNYRQSF
jgi:uncharacterized membrane protein YhiD involved in acid resistance